MSPKGAGGGVWKRGSNDPPPPKPVFFHPRGGGGGSVHGQRGGGVCKNADAVSTRLAAPSESPSLRTHASASTAALCLGAVALRRGRMMAHRAPLVGAPSPRCPSLARPDRPARAASHALCVALALAVGGVACLALGTGPASAALHAAPLRAPAPARPAAAPLAAARARLGSAPRARPPQALRPVADAVPPAPPSAVPAAAAVSVGGSLHRFTWGLCLVLMSAGLWALRSALRRAEAERGLGRERPGGFAQPLGSAWAMASSAEEVVVRCGVVRRRDVVWCGVVWCGVVWCGVVWGGVGWGGVGWGGVMWCGVVWCGVVWCGVVWCGVVWCGVVWCGVVCRRRCYQKAKAGMSTHGYR